MHSEARELGTGHDETNIVLFEFQAGKLKSFNIFAVDNVM